MGWTGGQPTKSHGWQVPRGHVPTGLHYSTPSHSARAGDPGDAASGPSVHWLCDLGKVPAPLGARFLLRMITPAAQKSSCSPRPLAPRKELDGI